MRRFALLAVTLACALPACSSGGEAPSPVADEADSTGSKKLLDCNVFLSGGGPDQQVTVRQKDGALVLEELTSHGSMESRPLSKAEWASKTLKLRRDPDDFGDVTSKLSWDAKEKAWMYVYKTSYWHAEGFADCD